MEKVDTNPDDHIEALPEDVQADIRWLDEAISKIMAGQSRTLWVGKFWGGTDQTIIGYGDLTYVGSNKKPVEWFKVGLAAQKNYISVYVSAGQSNVSLAKAYGKELGKVKVGSGSIGFKKLADVNVDKLLEVVEMASH